MKLDKQKYQQMLEQKSPNSPLWKDCLKAFLFGGAICTVGEGVSNFWQSRGDGHHHGVPRRAADLPAPV